MSTPEAQRTPRGYESAINIRMRLAALSIKDSQVVVAERLGFTTAFINDVIHGRRGITEKLAAAMGYQRVTLFKKGQP